MIIYRTSGNYHKGIKEIEVESINNDGTFTFINDLKMKRTKPFIPTCGKHQPHFFLTYEEAKIHLTKRIEEKIKEAEEQIKKGLIALNAL